MKKKEKWCADKFSNTLHRVVCVNEPAWWIYKAPAAAREDTIIIRESVRGSSMALLSLCPFALGTQSMKGKGAQICSDTAAGLHRLN